MPSTFPNFFFNVNDLCSFLLFYLLSSKRRPAWDSNPDLYDASAVFYQLRYQANWKLVIMRVNDKPIDGGY